MAPPSSLPSSTGLLRLASAAILLPLTVAVVWYGGAVFGLFLCIIAAAMSWELATLCGYGRSPATAIAMATAAAAPLLQTIQDFNAAAVAVVLGTASVAAYSLWRRAATGFILAPGLAYIALGITAAAWLRGDTDTGLPTLLWLIAIVVATDVGAYFTGRAIGGPKLAPRISPNKTWSGLAGGAILAGCVGLFFGVADGNSAAGPLTAVSVLLAVVAQLGDLLESAVKRHFSVKDASNLIPGHGGFLDRFDGYLTVMPAVALMSIMGGGSPVLWQ